MQWKHSSHKTCPCTDSLSWAGSAAGSLLQWGLSIDCSFPQGRSTCTPHGGPSLAAELIPAPMQLSMGYRNDLSYHGLFHRLQGNLCSHIRDLLPLTLCVCRALSLTFLSLFSHSCYILFFTLS